jgi:hypothetical protein
MSTVTKLEIDDEAFLIVSLIERCPRVMMLRELCQNAFDAAALADGPKEVRIGCAIVDGVRKLRIWNTGPGMDPVALRAMCDLSSSIGKLKSLDRNFGIGAKVAALPSNHLGLRYRSCTFGRAYEIVLGKRNGIYGRILRPDNRLGSQSGRMVEIVDVSDEIERQGGDLDTDWTEVVLLGMRPEQDTCLDPYDGDPQADPFWAPEYLFRRYGRVPKGVAIYIEPGLQWYQDVRQFTPIMDRLGSYDFHETVETSQGVKIHFILDQAHPSRPWENKSSEGALNNTSSMLAICWANELFDVHRGSNWHYEAPRYGIVFGARHLNVIIELPDTYGVIPEMYRQFLHYRHSSQGHVRAVDFSETVHGSRPQWVKDLAPSGFGDQLGQHAEQLSEDLKFLVSATQFRSSHSERIPDRDPNMNLSEQTRKFVDGVLDACGIEPVLLREKDDIRDRWLEGRAAVYYPETGQAFINMCYDSREAFVANLRYQLRLSREDLALNRKIEALGDFYYVRRIMRALIHGLSKANNPVNWQESHISRAISPEALSTAADDLSDHLWQAEMAAKAYLS